MRAEKVKMYLEKTDIDVTKLTESNTKKLPLEDQMILHLIKQVIENGNQSAFKTLMDAAYGVMAPGKGPDKDLSKAEHYQANFQGIENKEKIEDRDG